MELDTPVQFQSVQRGVDGLGDIPIVGTLPSGTWDVEARFAGGSWTGVASGATGSFVTVLPDQPAGAGALDVRLVGVSNYKTIHDVSVGDNWILAGQSNPSGYLINNQPYTSSIPCRLFQNTYTWAPCWDPIDKAQDGVDLISKETNISGGFGSIWPGLATALANSTGVPQGLVPAPKGGAGITNWLPDPADHFNRLTLYGSMATRARRTGAKAVLMWDGENNAIDGMSQADFAAALTTFADAVWADLGVPVIVCRLQNSTGIPDANEAAINAAIDQVVAAHPHVFAGPDLSGITSEDSFHIRTDGLAATVVGLWHDAVFSIGQSQAWWN